MDPMGPLTSNDYILIVGDYFSKYKEIKICRKITSTEIINLLKEILSRLGYPSSITTDNRIQFSSEEFKLCCRERNITLYNPVPYWPRQNSEFERQNRDILKRLTNNQAERRDCKVSSVTKSLWLVILDKNKRIRKSEIETRKRRKEERNIQIGKKKTKDCELEVGDKIYDKNTNKEYKLSVNFGPTTHTVERSKGRDMEVRNDETG